MVCFSGCLMSSDSIQKLFYGVCSAFTCSYEEFVREKVVFLSYSSAILGPSHTNVLISILKIFIYQIKLMLFTNYLLSKQVKLLCSVSIFEKY